MLAIVSRCRWYILVGLLLLTICTSAAADVTIRGRVRVWSPITNAYVPLRQARVRIVLWEFEDWDTGDLEVWTDDNGNYRGTKGNPWWRSGYNVFIKAFAETDRLEVQDTIPEVDGYQAYAGQVWAPEDNTTEINLDGGGARSNVTGCRVGGISCFGTASDTGRQNGERAFWICHEMTDHVLWLMGNTVIPTRYFEEKECAFPYNDDPTANFSYTWDAVYVPDATFAGSLEYQSHTFRHELGHGLMLDAYGLLDLPGSGSGPSHSFWTPIGNNEQAWKEGSSDFLADWTFFQAYGRPADDVTSISNPARDASFSAHPGNRESIEGEIDGALWLLTDPKGWKERLVQVPGRPEPNMWYDLFEDGAFTDFWPIFEGREPARFSDMSGEDSDTYVNYLASLYPDNKYDLKVLLAQRGIEIWGGEHVPIIDYNGPITWNGPDCTIPVYLEERDQLDLGHLTVEVYVNGARVLQQPVPNTGWEREDSYRLQGWKQPFEFVYHHIAPRPGHVSGTAQRNPRIRIVLDDGMTYAAHFENLNPPAGAQIGDLRCNVWRAVIKNSGDSRLKNIGVNVGLSGVEPSVKLGPWNVDSWMRRNWEGDSEVFRMTGGTVPDSFSLEFTATGSGKGGAGSALGTVTQTFSDTEGFGIGDHVVTIPLGNQLGGEAEVSYSIFLPDPVREARTHIPQAVLDQARGIARTPLGARNINPDVLRQAAYDTPGQNLRILAGQASHLLDDYARLQASVLEIEEEIEAKLNPQKAAVFESNKYLPGAVNPAGKEIRLLRPGAGARQVMLQTPDTPFLDTVTYGKGDVAAIPKQGIKALQEMRASIEEKQKETVDLCEQAPKLRTKLLQSADVVRSSTLTEEAKNRLLSGVPDLADRLSNLNPSADAFNPIMVKEKQVIDFALGRKPSEKEPTTTYEKLPGTLLPGATPPPMEKYPPKEAPPKEKLRLVHSENPVPQWTAAG